ncbi:MAG: hypothetical protein JW860_06000 [Sedimentisphaerales bacterium]|nr:hypothetical protein [Sedimentisphaerales bacterium]
MDSEFWWIIGSIAVLALGGIIAAYITERKRRADLLELAARLGFNYRHKDDQRLLAQLSLFHLCSQGRPRSRKVFNILEGAIEDNFITIFDYRYTVGSGKHSQTHTQTVIWFLCDRLNLPKFLLKPENIFHRIGGIFGYQDIDFPQYPEFSKKYLLRGEEDFLIRELFTDEVVGYFQWNPGLQIEGAGNQLLFYRGSKRVKPENIQVFLDEGLKAFHLFAQGG